MKKAVLLVFSLLITYLGFAQTEVIADGRLQTILEQHITYNQMAKTILGYRIKVAKFNGDNAKQKSFNLKDELQRIYPEQRTYVVFDEPDFVVKFGDFTTKLNAHSYLVKIKPQISTAVIFQDYINIPALSEEDLHEVEYYEDDMESEQYFNNDSN